MGLAGIASDSHRVSLASFSHDVFPPIPLYCMGAQQSRRLGAKSSGSEGFEVNLQEGLGYTRHTAAVEDNLAEEGSLRNYISRTKVSPMSHG